MLAALAITVLTMSPGGDVFARFGHTAILVEDEAGARVYNFGAYRGSDPHLVSQFLHNAIPYYLSVNEIDRFAWKYRDREIVGQELALDEKQPLVVRVTDNDFQRDVLERLGRLENKMDMLAGSFQPGRMKLAEDRVLALEKSDVRRGVYDRIVNAVITVAISAAIAMHDRLGIK